MWSSAVTFLESSAAPLLQMDAAFGDDEDRSTHSSLSRSSLSPREPSSTNESEVLSPILLNSEPLAAEEQSPFVEVEKQHNSELSGEAEEDEDDEDGEEGTTDDDCGDDENAPIAPMGWMASFVESFVETTEVTLSAAASTLREGVSETVSSVAANIVESDFYKNNLAYVPPDDSHPPPRPTSESATSTSSTPTASAAVTTTATGTSSATTTTAKANAPATSVPRAGRRGATGFFSLEESLLSQIDAPIEDRITAAAQSIGYLKINISQSRRLFVDANNRTLGTTHPYVTIRLGRHQQWTSSVAKEDPHRPGTFGFNREITLVAQDVHSDLIVEVRQKNVLVADTLIGQVLVPLTSIIPCVREAISGDHDRCDPYRLSSWFELFPLREGRRKFRPGSHDISQTGMWKPEPPLGYIHLDIELHLHGRLSMWAGYALPASEDLMDLPKNPTPTGDLKAMSAIVETGRGFKRNFQRVKTAFARLFSRGKYAWVPLKFMRKARTFEDWRISLFVLSAATFACLIAPPFLLPVNIYLVIFVSTVYGWNGWRDPTTITSTAVSGIAANEEPKYIVWNQDIHDPDDDLGSIQKLAKVIYLLEKFERWMGIAADVMERIIHAFSFADERVTIAALLSVGVICFGLSFALIFFSPGYLFYFAFLFWFFKPTVLAPVFSRRKKDKSPRHRRAMMTTYTMHSDENLRAEGKLAQAIAVAKLMAQAPALARNVFARVPTEDELGHRWIASLQRVHGEPPVFSDDEDDDVPSTEPAMQGGSGLKQRRKSNGAGATLVTDAPTDEIWLREL